MEDPVEVLGPDLPHSWDFTMVCPQSLSLCAFTEESRDKGVLMQAYFIPQQDKKLRVQSCLCAAHCYSDKPALRLDVRPYSGGVITLDIPLHITDSHSEETPPPYTTIALLGMN